MEHLSGKQIDKYLSLLGVKNTTPGINSLTGILKAHVIKIPFENVSKLYYLKEFNLRNIPDTDQYIEGIDKFCFGGTCYSNNYYLYLLLKNLGYDIKLCGADMSQPDVHIVSMVRLAGREYLIDCGNAAPFFGPLPRDLTSDYSIATGNSIYTLKPPDSEGRSRMEHYRDGKKIHGYLAKPEPRSLDYFSSAITGSFEPYSVFMNAVLLTRFYAGHSVIIHNFNLIEIEKLTLKKKKLADIKSLIAAIEEKIGIPTDVTRIALSLIGQFKDVWG